MWVAHDEAARGPVATARKAGSRTGVADLTFGLPFALLTEGLIYDLLENEGVMERRAADLDSLCIRLHV